AFVISAVSLAVAIVSFIISSKSQHLQDRVNEIELKLKEYELEEKEKEQQKVPCVEARINHITKDKYKIRIWNSGNSTAKNITASWDGAGKVLFFDQEKMPFEFLEPQKGFDLTITTCFGSPGKLCITTGWEDEAGEKHSKIQWCDL
ncbi:MAG: hypothetical protein K5779_02345, partial [Saccharofermentans sp.]|nr:hypothetical protein [Saccharofermentans sp.]